MSNKDDFNVSDALNVWKAEYMASTPDSDLIKNRSGIEIKPLYTNRDQRSDWSKLGLPGQYPFTRGIYPSMHRGRTWAQRQVIGFGFPEYYNTRIRQFIELGASAISLAVCNSVYRGYDADKVPPELLGTCGTVINHVEDMATAFRNVPIDKLSVSLNDPSPFTLLGFHLAVAKRRGISWDKLAGTSNQSDCISHFVANHMFFRIALAGARRIVVDHIKFCNKHLPKWYPLSVVGQHMQQAGATPAQAMGFTISSAIQYAEDCLAAGMDPDDFLPKFTFFFDISVDFFEEVAKFRAGRRIWAQLCRERFGAKNPRSWRFKFHGQTSGADLPRQQALNNISRVTVQAMAGIFGGLQSLHTNSYDEAISSPSIQAARIAVATQNILREEAGLTDVIDPLGGSFYVESLTDEMEEAIKGVIQSIDEAGGMYKAVENGIVQRAIGESSLEFQAQIETGKRIIVGVNAYKDEEEDDIVEKNTVAYPTSSEASEYLARLAAFKRDRSNSMVEKSLKELARSTDDDSANVYEYVVEAADAGATHGEICEVLRSQLGFGHPLSIV